MKIHVLFSPLNAEELYFTGKTVVVIDVLRATSVIVTAIKNGAKEITPIASIEFALKASGSKVLLGGERNTNKIEGFNLGNSPSEYSKENVENKSIIFFFNQWIKGNCKSEIFEKPFYLFIYKC
jgi:2-phosphosulfolactate phosphatase